MNSLDEIGTEAAKLMRGMEQNCKLAQPLLKQVGNAFDDATENKVVISINGAKSKSEWAKQANVSLPAGQGLCARAAGRERARHESWGVVELAGTRKIRMRGSVPTTAFA